MVLLAFIAATFGIAGLLALIQLYVFLFEVESIDLFGLYTVHSSTLKKFVQLSFVACWFRYRLRVGAHFFDYGLSGLSYRRTHEKLCWALLLVGVPLGAGGYTLGYFS